MQKETPVRRLILVLLLGLAPAIAQAAVPADPTTSPTLSWPRPGEARELTADEYQAMVKNHRKPLLVVNFWATWCAPCVAELPHFIAAYEEFEPSGVQFVGVSLDFLDEREKTVEPFLRKHAIPYPNYILNADQNAFLTLFPEEWSGAIPATFVYDRSGQLLAWRLQALTREELDALIEESLKRVGGS